MCSLTTQEWDAPRGADPQAAARRPRERRARGALPAGRHPPVGDPDRGARRHRHHLPLPAAEPCPQPGGSARGGTWHGVLHVRDRAVPGGPLPAALVVDRYGRGATWSSTFVMMWWLLDHPNVEQSLLSPRDVDQLVNHDFAGYYSTYAASHFAAEVWTNNVWVAGALPRPRRARAAGRLPAVPERREPRDHRLDHDPARPRAGVLGADPPARAARADRGVRRRRGRAAAVLVVGRAGRPDPRRSPSPARAARPARSPSGWSACCAVSGVIEAFVTPEPAADLGPDRDRVPGRGGVPRLRLRPRPPSRTARGDTGDLRPACPQLERPGARRPQDATRCASASEQPAAFSAR